MGGTGLIYHIVTVCQEKVDIFYNCLLRVDVIGDPLLPVFRRAHGVFPQKTFPEISHVGESAGVRRFLDGDISALQ